MSLDGKAVDRLQESTRVNLPFKPPTIKKVSTRDQPSRKRKHVSYKDADGGSESCDEENSKKKRKSFDKDCTFAELDWTAHDLKRFPTYSVKPFESIVSRRFSIPCMKNEKGEVIPTLLSGVSLGVRPQVILLPRPLHDPMEDHAIVLYDPTIDDKETEEEKREREKEEEKQRALKEAEEKSKGMFNPHKSLRKILGEDQKKLHVSQKVAVVLCPKLTKVLRPHQIEGVKVCRHIL